MKERSYLFKIFTLFMLSCNLYAQPTKEIFVSPSGSDKYLGTFEKPFLSPHKALEAIQREKNTNPKTRFVVYFREGTYFCLKTIELNESFNAPIVFAAYGNEKVIFHGGRNINGSKFQKCTDNAILNRLIPEMKDKLWVLDLKKNGIIDYGNLKQHGFGIVPEPAPLELFVNGESQTLARYPNQGILRIGGVVDQGSVPRNGDFTNRGGEFYYSYKRAERWTKADEIWLHGKFSFGYNDDHLKVARIDTIRRSIKVIQPHMYGLFPGSNIDSTNSSHMAGLSLRGYYAYNLLEEIDQPKEYFLDRKTGKIYFYPENQLNNSNIEVSLTENPFFSIKNTSNIKVVGIKFTCGRSMGIYLENSHNVTIDRCSFSNLGTVAISFGHPLKNNRREYYIDGSPNTESKVDGDFRNIIISNCLIFNTGTGGIIVEGGDRKTLTPGNNLIDNTEFYNTDRINNTYSPAIKLSGVGNIVRNCYFHDLKHMAIYYFGNDHLIEFNRLDKVCIDSDDMGAIYTGRNPSARGTIIQFNYLSNSMPKDKETNMCGVYVDDGSGGIIIRNNFFYKVGQHIGAIWIHGGFNNKIGNNIFMDCDVATNYWPWDDVRWKEEGMESPLMSERLLKEVNILDSVYQRKYPELKNYFTNFSKRLNIFNDNLLIRSQTSNYGDFILQRNKTVNDAGTVPEKIDYSIIRKNHSSIPIFPFWKVGITNKNNESFIML